eukprot:2696478-Rhodomonas_salina.1
MDHPHNLTRALGVKSTQYSAAEDAARRAQCRIPFAERLVTSVCTIPFIFGVRGAVLEPECQPLFKALAISQAKTNT